MIRGVKELSLCCPVDLILCLDEEEGFDEENIYGEEGDMGEEEEGDMGGMEGEMEDRENMGGTKIWGRIDLDVFFFLATRI